VSSIKSGPTAWFITAFHAFSSNLWPWWLWLTKQKSMVGQPFLGSTTLKSQGNASDSDNNGD
jgi:hypothetical protein